jgi:hypothetical protein
MSLRTPDGSPGVKQSLASQEGIASSHTCPGVRCQEKPLLAMTVLFELLWMSTPFHVFVTLVLYTGDKYTRNQVPRYQKTNP